MKIKTNSIQENLINLKHELIDLKFDRKGIKEKIEIIEQKIKVIEKETISLEDLKNLIFSIRVESFIQGAITLLSELKEKIRTDSLEAEQKALIEKNKNTTVIDF